MCVYIYICCMSVGVCLYTYGYILVFFFDLSILMFFSLFTLFSQICSDLWDHNENKTLLPVLCYPSIDAICMSAAIFQL